MSELTADELATADDLALVLQVGRDTIYRWARSGHIPAMHAGRLWRFDIDAVKAHLSRPRDGWQRPPRAQRRKP